MALSLQEQLLKAGLTDKKKAKAAEKHKKKNVKAARKGEEVVDEAKVAAEQARQEKMAKDKELNEQRKAEQEEKAIAAQIKQMIEMNSIKEEGDIAYNFKAGTKVKKIYVSQAIQDRLACGTLAIAAISINDMTFHVIPVPVAEKIQQRKPEHLIAIAEKSADVPAEDDPYAEYQIPDDLMW